MRFCPGLIIKMGGEIRCGWRLEALSRRGRPAFVTGIWTTVEHQHSPIIERVRAPDSHHEIAPEGAGTLRGGWPAGWRVSAGMEAR
ncbi:MAG: hypothetical protein ACI8XO_004355 [Verrucomicrobiales bacterium]|jgi:hypothetical protein